MLLLTMKIFIPLQLKKFLILIQIKISLQNIEEKPKLLILEYCMVLVLMALAKQLSLTNSEAKNYIENYFNRFPKIKRLYGLSN